MDIGKIHSLVRIVEVARLKGEHVDIETRKTLDEVRTTPFLDRVDCKVFVQYPHMISPTWEEFEGISGFEITPNGALSIFVGGNDADGDWGATQVVCWPEGRWIKFQTKLTAVKNPYCEAPVSEEVEGGKGSDAGE